MMLVATFSVIIFFFPPSPHVLPPILPPLFFVYFSHSVEVKMKKLILKKLIGMPKILGVRQFADPFSHFWAPWWPFWI